VPAPAILTQQLTRTFGAQTVIDHVDLAVPAGAVYGILGPMGAGKTTLVRLLLGLVPPTSGVAQLLGFDVRTDADAIRARTGVVLTAPGLYESLTALENLNLYASIWHLPAADRDARIQYLLEHLNLWPRRHERVAEWSPTMKHKLAIARALVHRPMLLILDEPTPWTLDLLDQELLRADSEPPGAPGGRDGVAHHTRPGRSRRALRLGGDHASRAPAGARRAGRAGAAQRHCAHGDQGARLHGRPGAPD
jgi:ABC-type Na+ transport system ATPase subunit NatA